MPKEYLHTENLRTRLLFLNIAQFLFFEKHVRNCLFISIIKSFSLSVSSLKKDVHLKLVTSSPTVGTNS